MNEEINAGMGSEKPKGHIRGIWAITIIVVAAILVAGGIWYWYYKTTVQDTGNLNTSTTSPSVSPSASGSTSALPSTSGSTETTDWKTYTSDYMTFKYPSAWKVVKEPKYPARIYERVELQINGVTLSGIDYDIAPYDYAVGQASDIGADTGITKVLENSNITIDGISGKRIITEVEAESGTGYGYIAIVPVSAGHFSAGFLMGRGDKTANTEITNKFNTLITTITIKKK